MDTDSDPLRRDRMRDARLVTLSVAIVLLLHSSLILIAVRPVFAAYFANFGAPDKRPTMTQLTLSIPGWLIICVAGCISVALAAIHCRTQRASLGVTANMAGISAAVVAGGLLLASLLVPFGAILRSTG